MAMADEEHQEEGGRRVTLLALFSRQTIKERLTQKGPTGRITVTLSQDNQRTTKPTLIDDRRDRPTLVGEIIVTGDDEHRVTKIAPGQLNVTMAGTIPHQQGQLIEDRSGKGTTLDTDALLNGSDVEEELVRGTGHDDK